MIKLKQYTRFYQIYGLSDIPFLNVYGIVGQVRKADIDNKLINNTVIFIG